MAVSVTNLSDGTQDWKEDGTNTVMFSSDSYNYMLFQHGGTLNFGLIGRNFGRNVMEMFKRNINVYDPINKREIYVEGSEVLPAASPNHSFAHEYLFNQNVRISDATEVCSDMFYNFRRMNSEVIIGNNAKQCDGMFQDCYAFNQPINIPESVTNCNGMFCGCLDLNQDIKLPNNVTDIGYMFSNCQFFTPNFRIPQSVTKFAYAFRGTPIANNSWDGMVIDSEAITRDGQLYLLAGTVSVYNTSFYQITDPQTENAAILNHRLVSPLKWASRVTGETALTVGTFNFGPIHIGDNVTNCVRMFNYYQAFNQPVTIGNNVTNCAEMFDNATWFNQPIEIPNSVVNCYAMFRQCRIDQNIMVSNRATNCAEFMQGSYMNQKNIVFPSTVTDLEFAFKSSSVMNGVNIYIANAELDPARVHGIIMGCNKNNMKNIYVKNFAIVNNTTAGYSITNTALTWAPISNGYFSSAQNICIFNNYPEWADI